MKNWEELSDLREFYFNCEKKSEDGKVMTGKALTMWGVYIDVEVTKTESGLKVIEKETNLKVTDGTLRPVYRSR